MSRKYLLSFFAVLLASVASYAQTIAPAAVKADQLNESTIELIFDNGIHSVIDFYTDNIFRFFYDPNGGIVRKPKAESPADIIVHNARESIKQLTLKEETDQYLIETSAMTLKVNKANGCITVENLDKEIVLEQLVPLSFDKESTTLTLKAQDNEYFYGGGVQNGRFSHKGKIISIVNENSWVNGGVASPSPFYWSTKGYALLCHTFQQGCYDFGASEKGKVKISHDTDYADIFIMVDEKMSKLLADYYQLTGEPILLPKFAFYEGHLNAYNRDYWKENEKSGILFEDGKYYTESQNDTNGVKETLNGENNNYQFSARAAIDRYSANDMPLGWFLPNDGYGAGYGQTSTLDGNIENLKKFGDYARSQGVEIGLWTQSDLHPKKGIPALLQRDLVKEVRDAGVRVLKTDVAWVGAGYSFGLNGITDAGEIMQYYGNDARSFIISLDGWAGTQRYAGIWTGDQTGGEWEYIRFHIPTYIGSGLSGIPNICSDMDGIFGGKNPIVNTRDFQWKAFTTMQLNMDGWGANPKYPHIFGEPTTSINRWYLKLKSILLPYSYSIAHEATHSLPIIRPMMTEEMNSYTLGQDTRYQYMYGPFILVAPIYQNTASDKNGNDIRNMIYLPKGEWIDYFTGDSYTGGTIINTFDAPIWKLPVFIKNGAIIPIARASNHPTEISSNERLFEIYPSGHTEFTSYDDDGISNNYQKGEYVETRIESELNKKEKQLKITIHPTQGSFKQFTPVKTTELHVNVTRAPKGIKVCTNHKKASLKEVMSKEEFQRNSNVYYYEQEPDLNQFATPGSEFASRKVIKNPMIYIKLDACDITSSLQEIIIKDCIFEPTNDLLSKTGKLSVPKIISDSTDTQAYRHTARWARAENADYYEIAFNNVIYSTIQSDSLAIDGLECNKEYTLKLRAVNKEEQSKWAKQTFRTARDPFEWTIRNIHAESTAPAQPGAEEDKLFTFTDKGEIWHTMFGQKAVPMTTTMDLGSVNVLDKLEYVPRSNAGNGTLLKGEIMTSIDGQNWKPSGAYNWNRDNKVKTFVFEEQPTARYIRLDIREAVGDYGSGRKIRVYKVPHTSSYLAGDINNDGKIDESDFVSYMNYAGLQQGDSDFEGYISQGDINQNGLIDAFDISNITINLTKDTLQSQKLTYNKFGKMSFGKNNHNQYRKGQTIQLIINGSDLKDVTAFSLSIPYSSEDFEYISTNAMAAKHMENLTRSRLHTNGETVLHPTFVNKDSDNLLNGESNLCIVTFKVKKDITHQWKIMHPCIVSKVSK